MMRNVGKARTLIVTFGLVCVSASSSYAQDAIVEPTAGPAPIWTGAYIGGFGGGTFGHHKLTDVATGASKSESGSRAAGGVYGGYAWQHGNWVMGAELDWTGIEKGDGNNLVTVRGRLGYAFDRTLIFGTVGWGSERTGLVRHNSATGAIIDSIEKRVSGLVIGGGAETFLLPLLSVRAEALYFTPGDEQFDFPANGIFAAGSAKLDFNQTIVRAGLTYHFN